MTTSRMEFFPGSPVSLRGKTLVVPAVSIGNVGQLAADLLIATLGLERLGAMLSPTALPAVGLGAIGGATIGEGDDETGDERERLSTELELFSLPSSSSSKSDWVLLQQRSPDAPGSSRAAARALCEWARSAGIEKIVALASVDAADRRDVALSSPSSSSGPRSVSYVAAGAGLDELAARAESAGAATLERGGQETSERLLPPWPLLSLAGSTPDASPPTLALVSHATEGDNAADAVRLAEAAAAVLGVDVGASESSVRAPGASKPKSPSTIPVSGPWRAPAAWAAAYGGRAVPVEM